MLTLTKPGTPVVVRTKVRSLTPQVLEIVHDGTVVASTEDGNLEIDLLVSDTGWLAARCRDAHTSPIYLRFEDSSTKRQSEAVARLLAHIDRLENWATEPANGVSEQAQARLLAMGAAARNVLH